jgi:hypothetical protein
LSVVVSSGLVDRVRLVAVAEGVPVVRFVERALEVALDGYVDVGPGSRESVASYSEVEGGGAVSVSERDLVHSPPKRGIANWEKIISDGLAVKGRVPVVESFDVDPLDVIA